MVIFYFHYYISHSTTLLELPYILREGSFHYFDIATSTQPRLRCNTPISDISDIEFLADASRFDILIERFKLCQAISEISKTGCCGVFNFLRGGLMPYSELTGKLDFYITHSFMLEKRLQFLKKDKYG